MGENDGSSAIILSSDSQNVCVALLPLGVLTCKTKETNRVFSYNSYNSAEFCFCFVFSQQMLTDPEVTSQEGNIKKVGHGSILSKLFYCLALRCSSALHLLLLLLNRGVCRDSVVKGLQYLLLLFWMKCCAAVGIFFCLLAIPVLTKKKKEFKVLLDSATT